ncbi:PLP-dependent aminotransferase family protein [Actinomadura craniellae]|uniref:PLP-dependent aminotransferase family protein n=1 Tax=Actinomadura craniellae TaxID=2231787 RepID=A0A365H4A6_9ACTN|nr:PLP-dependent aminotransferase family protein [Actinomadura craniellae]RAY13937.1 PLP-dependent aminotransferase family protein [Actinomadura craniellae]
MNTQYVSGLHLARLLAGPPDERPYYAALAREIRRLVLDGRLPARVRLPAERDLAAALGVSRTTVTAAYDRLRDQGFVESRQGAGSWTALPSGTVPPGARFGMSHAWPGSEVIDLGCAAPSAPRIFPEAVAAAVARLPEYEAGPGYEPAGLAVLRATVAARYTERGLPTRPDQIVITSGAQQACTLLFQVLVESGDAVLAERPTYPHALDALRRRGARVVPVGVDAGWDIELIGSGLRQAAARVAYVIPDFQNPTGRLLDDAGRAALVAAAQDADALLVADETFTELPLAGSVPRPLAVHDPARVICVGSAAKLLWGGLRIGWIRTTAPLVRRLVLARESFDIASSVLDQLITDELLHRIDEVRAERVEWLTRGRDALTAALGELLPDWTFTAPAGGMSLWVRLPAPVATDLAAAALRHGVRVMPGPVFGTEGVLEDRLRLPFVLPPETLRTAVERLAAAYREVESAPAARPLPAYV